MAKQSAAMANVLGGMAKQSAAMASVPGAMLTHHSLIVMGKHADPRGSIGVPPVVSSFRSFLLFLAGGMAKQSATGGMAKQSAAMASMSGAMLTHHSLIVMGKHAEPRGSIGVPPVVSSFRSFLLFLNRGRIHG